jgi:large subunit ribosomal protein L27
MPFQLAFFTAFDSQQIRFASKKQGGKSKNGRDSNPKYLGIKMTHGQVRTKCAVSVLSNFKPAISGNIIIRQRGTRWWPGEGVKMGMSLSRIIFLLC